MLLWSNVLRSGEPTIFFASLFPRSAGPCSLLKPTPQVSTLSQLIQQLSTQQHPTTTSSALHSGEPNAATRSQLAPTVRSLNSSRCLPLSLLLSSPLRSPLSLLALSSLPLALELSDSSSSPHRPAVAASLLFFASRPSAALRNGVRTIWHVRDRGWSRSVCGAELCGQTRTHTRTQVQHARAERPVETPRRFDRSPLLLCSTLLCPTCISRFPTLPTKWSGPSIALVSWSVISRRAPRRSSKRRRRRHRRRRWSLACRPRR